MLTRSPRVSSVLFTLTFTLSCVMLTLYVWLHFGGDVPFTPLGYTLHMEFAQAQNLLPNEDVRIAGVSIGKVLSVTPTTARTDAVIELHRQYAPLSSDARAILRTKTLLGETFVEITPGTPGAAKIPDGGVLPTSQITPTQQLDQFLNTFDAPTRTALRELLSGTAAATHGVGNDLNQALGWFDPNLQNLDTLLHVLDNQQPDLQGLVRNSGIFLHALGDQPAALRGFVTNGERTLAALDGSRNDLAATIDAFAPFQTQLASTVHEASLTADVAAPTLRTLLPASSESGPAIAGADQLAQALRGLLHDSGPAIAATYRDLPSFEQLVRASAPLLRQLYPAGSQLVPLLELIGVYKREIVSAIANFGASAQASAPSATGAPKHYIRGINVINNEYYVAYDYRFGTNRHNAYPAPGQLDNLAHGFLRTSNCANAGNGHFVPPLGPPGTTGAPPCLTQKPWFFNGASRYFPHMTPAR